MGTSVAALPSKTLRVDELGLETSSMVAVGIVRGEGEFRE